MALISCLTGRKKMRANENFTEIFGSDEEQLRGKYRIGLCKSCECAVDNAENYCSKCGQKLDWSE